MKNLPTMRASSRPAMARRAGPRTRSAQAGVSLVEALVAFLITAFGMLGIAGMQASLSRNADTAKQRSEAVRLAQQKMEELRSFDSLSGGTYSYGADVVSDATEAGITPGASNTTFTRSWTVTRDDGATATVPTDTRKWIHVSVDWTDRQGATQSTPVSLHSVIARNDPIMLKGLVAGQARPKVRYPKGRNLNIPYPAVGTSDPTRSAFIPPPGNVTYVFDNATGKIVQACTGVSALVEDIDLSAYACTNLNAYLLSGYVRFFLAGSPSADDLIEPNGDTLALRAATDGGPISIDASATGHGPSAYACYAQRQKVVTASNVSPATIARRTSLSSVRSRWSVHRARPR
jgi:Tfp pilus assembly protein PilV